MKNVKLNLKKTAKAGFSLVEMLVVLAVIGVIFAIAIPNIGSISESANAAAAQRNAQLVVSVLNEAATAGANLSAEGVSDATSALHVAKAGIILKEGNMKGKAFIVGDIPIEDEASIIAHIVFVPERNLTAYIP